MPAPSGPGPVQQPRQPSRGASRSGGKGPAELLRQRNRPVCSPRAAHLASHLVPNDPISWSSVGSVKANVDFAASFTDFAMSTRSWSWLSTSRNTRARSVSDPLRVGHQWATGEFSFGGGSRDRRWIRRRRRSSQQCTPATRSVRSQRVALHRALRHLWSGGRALQATRAVGRNCNGSVGAPSSHPYGFNRLGRAPRSAAPRGCRYRSAPSLRTLQVRSMAGYQTTPANLVSRAEDGSRGHYGTSRQISSKPVRRM
jgi:hypothetical protein